MQTIVTSGNCVQIPEIPAKIREIFTAPKKKLRVQLIFRKNENLKKETPLKARARVKKITKSAKIGKSVNFEI